MASSAKTSAKTGTVEPDFNQLSISLAEADAAARAASGDATQARNKKSEVATSTIRAAYGEKIDSKTVRETLLAAGVLKGTVSKIVTVLDGLADKLIDVSDVKSLNGAYQTVKAVKLAAATVAAAGAAAAAAFTGPIPTITATTPKEAIEVLIATVKAVKDPDEAMKLVSQFITQVTNGLTAAVKSIAAEEDE